MSKRFAGGLGGDTIHVPRRRVMADPVRMLPERVRIAELAKLRRESTEALVEYQQELLVLLSGLMPSDQRIGRREADRAYLQMVEQVLAERAGPPV